MFRFFFYTMIASVHIPYSPTLKVYYTGFTTTSVDDRLNRHLEEYYDNNYNSKAKDWEIYLVLECISVEQARAIESQIKK